jgi:rRNA maturation RNase YbeY
MQNNSIEIYNEARKTPIKDWNFLYEKFEVIKNKILGNKFSLSISILNSRNAQMINKKMRRKAYTPNTLSFKYSRTSGEIVLCPEVFMKQDYNIGNKFESKVVYLFIHSCVHLLDLDHGPKMDKLEKKFIKAFVV